MECNRETTLSSPDDVILTCVQNTSPTKPSPASSDSNCNQQHAQSLLEWKNACRAFTFKDEQMAPLRNRRDLKRRISQLRNYMKILEEKKSQSSFDAEDYATEDDDSSSSNIDEDEFIEMSAPKRVKTFVEKAVINSQEPE